MRWLAFYADGRRRSSAESSWAALPAGGLVVAVWWDGAGRRHLECGADALVHTGAAIVSVNLPGPNFRWAAGMERLSGVLKYGTLMAPEAWARVRQEADEAVQPPER